MYVGPFYEYEWIVFICGLFNDAVSSLDSVRCNETLINE
jgi:hypothetical protein